MQNILYYPDFEIKDKNLLKLCLIYMDEIDTIVPESALNELSEDTQRIMYNTNFLKTIQPEYELIRLAYEATIYYLKNKGESVYRNINSIHHYTRNNRYADRTYILYREKYTYEFENFCIDSGIGVECDKGVMVPENVGYTYMSILADIISKDKQMDMLTDYEKYSDRCFSNKKEHKFRHMLNELQFFIPVDIDNIPLERFIELRADKEFDYLRRKFNENLNNILKRKDNGDSNIDLYEYRKIKDDICEFIKNIFLTSVCATVGVCSFGNTLIGSDSKLDFFGNVGSGILSLGELKRQFQYDRDIIERLEGKIQARRYLAKLRTFGYADTL